MALAIETELLTKHFRGCEAVKRVTLSVPRGTVSGFLGQNGSGKSTTLKMLMGAIHPTSGTGRVLTYKIDDPDQSVEIRKRVAFVSEDKRLYEYMTVGQIICFTRAFFPKWRDDLQQDFLSLFPLPLDRKIKKLSKGMRTQLALLLGIGRGPEILVLDEPTEGLDPVAIEAFLQFLLKLAAEGTTVFFSSHQIAEVEQIATHLFIIDRGELVLSSPVDRLKETWSRVCVELPTVLQPAQLMMKGVQSIRKDGASTSVFTTSDVRLIVDQLHSFGATAIEVKPIALKDIFRQSLQARK